MWLCSDCIIMFRLINGIILRIRITLHYTRTGNVSVTMLLVMGPLMGGPQCRMSNLGNGNVACPCRLFSLMSHVEFKKRLCPMWL